ncbi:50S ribosomal protein L25 [Patescibacteria group bacterium]
MSNNTLEATARKTIGRKNYQIRNVGKVPAVVYGAGLKESQNITIDRNAFVNLFKTAGESTIVDLKIDGQSYNVLIQAYQLDPVRDEVIHADFRAVDMNKPLEAEVKLIYVGEPAAVKALGGTLITPLETVTVKALPKDLVSQIEVDLESLKTFDDVIHIEDLNVPAGIEILDKPERTLAVVSPPRTDAEMAKLDETVEGNVAEVEVEDKKKEDGEAKEGETTEEKPSEEKKD